MSMLDLTKVYENAAELIASDLQSFIGTKMVMTQFDFSKLKTKEGRRNPNTGEGTLRVLTGKLFRSFTPKQTKDGNIYALKITEKGFEFTYGSSIAYASIHEFGGTAGRGGTAVIPARPYFNPALREWTTKKFDITKAKVKIDIIKALQKWQESQRS
jgi:phage gpG-like protein